MITWLHLWCIHVQSSQQHWNHVLYEGEHHEVSFDFSCDIWMYLWITLSAAGLSDRLCLHMWLHKCPLAPYLWTIVMEAPSTASSSSLKPKRVWYTWKFFQTKLFCSITFAPNVAVLELTATLVVPWVCIVKCVVYHKNTHTHTYAHVQYTHTAKHYGLDCSPAVIVCLCSLAVIVYQWLMG